YYPSADPHDLPSFPPRRSSDLKSKSAALRLLRLLPRLSGVVWLATIQSTASTSSTPPDTSTSLLKLNVPCVCSTVHAWCIALWADRKSTRLNSSHVKISYAVFC